MTTPDLARIWIGGQLRRSVSYRLVMSVRQSGVSVGLSRLEHYTCMPKSIEGLFESRLPDGRLHLQHPEGTLDDLVKTSRSLGLTYRLWRSSLPRGLPLIEGWRPGLEHPVRALGHPLEPDVELVDAARVREAIELLELGRTDSALPVLAAACPRIPEVPPLELVND